VPRSLAASPLPMLPAEMIPLAVPEFVTIKVHWREVGGGPPASTQLLVPVTDTFADEPSVPKSPKAKPAMATPATRVMAMRMTVARIGEIAFLSFLMRLLRFTQFRLGVGSGPGD